MAISEHRLKLLLEVVQKGRGFDTAAKDAVSLENAIRDLRQELDRSERAFEQAKSESITLKTEYKSLKQSGEGTKDMFRALSEQISKAEARELDAITATRKLAQEIGETGDESIATSDDLRELNARLQESEGYITGVGGKAALQAQKMDELRGSVDKTGDELGQLGGKADQANSSLRSLDKGVDTTNTNLEKIEKRVGTTAYAMGNILADGIQDAAQALFDFGKESFTSFKDFDEDTRRIFAQVPDLSADMRDSLAGDAKVIAAAIGRVPQETLPALRKALNLGISEDNLLTDIKTASNAARIGGESLIDTMVLGQSVVNAYGQGVYSLADVYDQLNYITQSSNLEFGDLNANMNQIISAAAEAGIGLDSVAGAMVTMNRQGDDATEIADLLANVLTQISIEGTALGAAFKEAAGVGFREFTAAGGTLSEGLQILQQHAQDTGQDLLNMVGGSSPFYRDVQAARGVLELTGRHAAELAENTGKAADATGSLAQSANEFANSPALTYDRAAASVENLKISTGQWLAQLAEGINLIENTNAVASLLSGTLDHQIGSRTDDIVEQAQATGEYAEALQQLAKGYNAAQGAGPFDFGLTDDVTASTEVLIREMARISQSYDEFQQRLAAAGANNFGQTTEIGGFGFNTEQLYFQEQTAATQAYYQALADADYWQTEVTETGGYLADFYGNYGSIIESTIDSTNRHTEATISQAEAEEIAAAKAEAARASFENLNTTVSGLSDVIAAAYGEDAVAGTEENSLRIQEANAAVSESYKNTALQILEARLAETIATDGEAAAIAMIKFQEALGTITPEESAQLQEVATKTQNITDATGEMLDKYLSDGVLTQQEIDNLAEAVALVEEHSDLTKDSVIRLAEEGVEGMGNLQGSSEDTEQAFIDAKESVSDLGTEIDELPDSKTIDIYINEHHNSSGGSGSSGSGGSTSGDEVPMYSGGNMIPGRAYLLGDTASGQPTPYSEIVIPQGPAEVIGARKTREILNTGDTFLINIDASGAGPGVEYLIEGRLRQLLDEQGREADIRIRNQ